jgi:uncharacterized protein (TIGR04141 family)
LPRTKKYEVVVGGQRIGSMHVPPRKDVPPGWLKKVKPFVPGLPNIVNSTASTAAILVPVGTRTFALTLGYGRTLLEHDSFEDDFGLKVTLNAVPPGNIRVIDRSSFDAFAHQTRTQGLRSGGLEQFGLDMEQDILRAVVGKPKDDALGERMAGKDALVFTARTDLSELPDLLSLYLTEFRSRQYQRTYPDLDKLAVVRDGMLLKRLEQKLLKKVREGDGDRLWLAVPDFVDWASVGFRYSTASYEPYPDLHLTDFLDRVRVDLDKLEIQGRRVYCVDTATGQEKDSWPLMKCIYCELVISGDTFVLSNGDWYQIQAAFVGLVDRAINPLLEPSSLPDYLKRDKDEAGYNKRVAKEKGYFKFDRRNVSHGGRRGDQIEPCDLLTKQRQLIHVKRYAGSSVLSHLFAQGLTSSDLLADDAVYRGKMRNKITDAAFKPLIPDNIDPQKYEIVYAIVGRPIGTKKLAEMLPFFSRVNLRRTAKQLKRMGYKVSVEWVTNTAPKKK